MNKFEIVEDYKHKGIKLPTRQSELSAGYDICAAASVVINPFDVVLVPTGLKCQIDSDKYLGLHMRSSVAINNKVCLIHGQGIIDADYYNNEKNEGHIMIPLINMGKIPFYVKEGERLVQGIFTPYGTTVNDADDIKECRKGGFGSTGR